MREISNASRKALRKLLIRFNLFWITTVVRKTAMTFDSILILSPHPDDEIIGLGGIILQTLQREGKVYIVYLTDGEGADSHPDKGRIKQERFLLTEKILNNLMISRERVYWLHLKDGGIPGKGQSSFLMVSEKLSKIIDETGPQAVFATHFLDRYADHIACSELAKEAVKKAKNKPSLWFYWVWAPFFLLPWQLPKTLKSKKIDTRSQYDRKKELTDIYLIPKSPIGMPWSGYLPEVLCSPSAYEIIENRSDS